MTVNKKIAELKEKFKNLGTYSETNRASDPAHSDGLIQFTSIKEVSKLIRWWSNKTSSEWDGILNVALKRLPRICIRNYTVTFNNCLNNAYFPEVWKLAKLIILIKKITALLKKATWLTTCLV